MATIFKSGIAALPPDLKRVGRGLLVDSRGPRCPNLGRALWRFVRIYRVYRILIQTQLELEAFRTGEWRQNLVSTSMRIFETKFL